MYIRNLELLMLSVCTSFQDKIQMNKIVNAEVAGTFSQYQ